MSQQQRNHKDVVGGAVVMRYIYESHLGGIYFDTENKPSSELYCETCGDYDWCLGRVETLADCWEVIKTTVTSMVAEVGVYSIFIQFQFLNFFLMMKFLMKIIT